MKVKLGDLIEEYSERNIDNKYKPVAVGKYGIRARESIYSKELAKDYSKNKLIYKGTLTIGMGSNQIDIGILRDDKIYSVSPAYHTYNIKISNYDYLDYLLTANNNRMFSIYANRGSRQGKTLDLKRWLTDELRLHDEKDQKIIVQTLNAVKQLISQKEAELVKLDNLIKARFVEMFGGIDLAPQNKEWTKISDIGEVVSGSTPKTSIKEYWNGNICWITPAELSNMSGIIYDSKKKITERGKSSCSLRMMPSRTVILSSRAPIGKVALLGKEMCCNQGFKNIICNEKVAPEYLYYLLGYNTIFLNSLGRGATFKEISKKIVGEIKVPLPAKELQNQFAVFTRQVDKSKFVLSNELTMCDFYIRLIHDRVMHSRINLRVAQ